MTDLPTPAPGRTAADTAARDATARARAMQREWAGVPLTERRRRLRRLRQALLARADDVVETVNAEVGKPPTEAFLHEVTLVSAVIASFERIAPAALRSRGVRSWPLLHRSGEVWYEPYGVVGVISPANFPFLLAAVPCVSAIVAGNAVVLKPSERAPRTARLLEALVREAIPEFPGLLTLLPGGAAEGAALIGSGIGKVVFVGGVESGRRVAAEAARHLVPAVLELGANDAGIVCDDADLERAAAGVVWGATANAGQLCLSMQRALVHERVYSPFLELAAGEFRRIRVPGEVGSLIAGGDVARVSALVDDAVANGARLIAGGHRVASMPDAYEPTLLADVGQTCALHREEAFGPVLAVTSVRDDAEAVRIAGLSPFGLNASIWTRDASRARKLAAQLRCGAVVVNDLLINMGMPLPYGGVGLSGYGRLLGEDGLREFVRSKSVVTSRASLPREPYWYPYTERRMALLRRLTRLGFGAGMSLRLRALLRRR